jgi:hypothetical protein
MKWMRERDLLIAQTMEFVQSVTGKRPDAEIAVATNTVATSVTLLPVETSSIANVPTPMHDKALLAVGSAVAEPPKPALSTRPDLRDEFQSEIKARVANFRAHQELFNREREAYCSATMARVHASIKESELPPRLDK